MERCTERSFGGYGILKSGYTDEFALCKLATYEDTGLTPEEIQNDIRVFTDMWKEKITELQKELYEAINRANTFNSELFEYHQAEEQGLLIKLPCKVGDILYGIYEDKTIREMHVLEVRICEKNVFFVTNKNRSGFYDHMIGKTVFITREAAEQSLKGSTS